MCRLANVDRNKECRPEGQSEKTIRTREGPLIYQAVIFDFDNTLINYNVCEQEALKLTLLRHGLIEEQEADWHRFVEIYNPINWSYWERRHEFSREDLTYRTFRDALEQFLGRSDIARELAETYWELFCNSCHFEPGARDTLLYVRGKYRTGLITNGYGDSQRKRLRACGIDGLFDSLVISDEVGLWKPYPRIFKFALDDLDVPKERVLFVGDSLSDDYRGAKNAGIDFCFYNRGGIKSGEEIDAKFEIRQLGELQRLL